VVEHVATDEEEDGNHASGSPDVSTLDNGKNVWRSGNDNSDGTSDEGEQRRPLDPIDRASNFWVRTSWEMTGDPVSDLLSRGWARICIRFHSRRAFPPMSTITHPVVKSYRTGSGEATA
jgi:hypothetical protein